MDQTGLWRQISRGREILNQGGIIGMPTETVYGLAARIDRPEAVRKIFETKERPFFDPLIVHLSSIAQLPEVVSSVAPVAAKLAEYLWPGPLTLVLPRGDKVSLAITAGLETVGVRMPSHPVARRLLRTLGVPVAAPSANKFGRASPTTAEHVRAEFGSDVFVIDGGPSTIGLESTVLAVEGQLLTILRPGLITAEEVSAVLRQEKVEFTIRRGESLASPGSLETHYMPAAPLVIAAHFPLADADWEQIRETLKMTGPSCREVALSNDPLEVARTLYASLRDLSRAGGDFLVVVRKETQRGEAWEAIWNRLEKAASLDLARHGALKGSKP